MIILFFIRECAYSTQFDLYGIYFNSFCVRFLFFIFVFLLLLFTSFVRFVYEAATEIIQLNKHLRHWFSASISLDIRMEYMLFYVFHWVRFLKKKNLVCNKRRRNESCAVLLLLRIRRRWRCCCCCRRWWYRWWRQ